jgi:hypothetical protein
VLPDSAAAAVAAVLGESLSDDTPVKKFRQLPHPSRNSGPAGQGRAGQGRAGLQMYSTHTVLLLLLQIRTQPHLAAVCKLAVSVSVDSGGKEQTGEAARHQHLSR